MNRTTSWLATALRIQSWTACSLIQKSSLPLSGAAIAPKYSCLDVVNAVAKSIWSGRRGQGQGVQNPTHPPFQRLIDHLVLLHPRLALKFLADDVGRVMIAIAGKIPDGHLGVGKARLDQARDFLGIHGHQAPLRSQGTVQPMIGGRPPATANHRLSASYQNDGVAKPPALKGRAYSPAASPRGPLAARPRANLPHP